MRITKSLVIGLVAAVVAGIVLGTMAGPALAGRVNAADSPPMTVPVGNVGDRVTFATFTRNPETHEWVPDGSEGFVIERLAPTVDEDGRLRPAVEVISNRSTSILIWINQAEIERQAFTEHDFVDLETRRSVRTDVRAGTNLSVSFFGDWPAAADSLAFQGQTLVPGEPLPASQEGSIVRPILLAIVFGFQFPIRPMATLDLMTIMRETIDLEQFLGNATVETLVAQTGAVDGQSAYGVRTTVHFKVEENADGLDDGDADTEVSMERTDWLSAEIPYPLATEFRVRIDEKGEPAEVQEYLRSLIAFEPGAGQSLEWGSPAPATEHERSPQAGAPIDGQESTLAYPLSLAQADLESDLTNVEFQGFRVQHPEAALVSAELGRAESSRPERPAYRWDLVFADGDQGIRVWTERTTGVPLARTGAGSGPGYEPEIFGQPSERPLTLAAVETIWRSVAGPDYRDRAPDRVLWGVNDQGEGFGAACLFPTGHGPNVNATRRHVLFGYSDGGECAEPSNTMETSLVRVNLTTAEPDEAFEVRRGSEFDLPLVAGSPTEPQTPVAASSFASAVAPQIVGATFFTTSFIVAFLIAYFWPTIKFVAARGLFLLPGYSKLAKDKLLDNHVRDDLLAAIQESPGVHASELGRRVDAGWGTIVYHLAVLERNKLVSSLVEGRHRRYFPVGIVDWSERSRIALLQHAATRRAYDLVLAQPGITTSDIARRMGVTTAGAMWHLGRIEQAGLILRERKGRTVSYRPAAVEMAKKVAVAT